MHKNYIQNLAGWAEDIQDVAFKFVGHLTNTRWTRPHWRWKNVKPAKILLVSKHIPVTYPCKSGKNWFTGSEDTEQKGQCDTEANANLHQP